VSSGMVRRVALVRTDVSEEPSASFIRVTRIGELGTTLAVTSNRRSVRRLLVTAINGRRQGALDFDRGRVWGGGRWGGYVATFQEVAGVEGCLGLWRAAR
jgi:hypothetical protein